MYFCTLAELTLAGVMATSGVPMVAVTVLPLAAFRACWTPSMPSWYGSWATASWIVLLLRNVICCGSASKVATLTLPVLPACCTPVAAPWALSTLVANTPLRSGWAAMSLATWLAAVAELSLSYWTDSTLTFGYLAFISALKPAMRASVVLMPGLTLITATVPLPPIWLPRLSAAILPPPVLSEVIRETPSEVSLDEVSTNTILVPALWIRFSSGSSALASVGATISASGLLPATALRIGACSLTEKSAGPVTVSLAPSFLASASAPHSIVT